MKLLALLALGLLSQTALPQPSPTAAGTPDGRRLYVAETGRDQVAEVDFRSGRVLRRFAVGRQGDGLAIAPPAR